MKNGTILIIEEEVIIAMEMKMRLEAHGYEVVSLAKSAEDGVRLATKLRPDLILTEIIFKGELEGINAVSRIKKLYQTPVIYLTTLSYLETDPRITATKPDGFISKPVDDEKLFKAINKIPSKH
ncbi:response regulator [candidate division KSB1 bacterium]|nr:response regulator [candidate division KSB1 bacterium]MBL7092890.1 response regulator [candidate division KSB1 bacterium]